MPPTTSWDENSPSGSDSLNQGDNRIRELKTQIREVIDVDHDFPSSGSASDVGQHKKCTFQEQADLGTGAVNATILGSQTVSGKGELVYSDEDNNDVQITTGGKIRTLSLKADSVADMSNLLALIYPVGIVITLGVSTNPGTLFGVGTWTAIAGRVIVGIDAGQTEFDTLDETGGAKTVTLDSTMIPAHTHTVDAQNDSNSGGTGALFKGAAAAEVGEIVTSGSTGGGAAHNNLQPYIVKYVWQRTA